MTATLQTQVRDNIAFGSKFWENVLEAGYFMSTVMFFTAFEYYIVNPVPAVFPSVCWFCIIVILYFLTVWIYLYCI